MIKKLCIISSYYPSERDPYYAFVGSLVSAVADCGVECHVISPVSNLEEKHRAVSRVEVTSKGSNIHVYCPSYLVFPSRNLLGFQTYRLTAASKRRAIESTFKKYIKECDAIYSHFIDSGTHAAWLSKRTGIPAFAAVGESSITDRKLSYTVFKRDLHDHIKGVVSVSSELKRDIYQYDVFSKDTPVEVFPNAIDTDLFRPMDKAACRIKLGIAEHDFVVSFVGGFIKRKGFDTLQTVIGRHPDWKCILFGAGDIPVTLPAEQVVFSGRVAHENIPEYLCASDVFALPTKAEGCCNAIVEAMGCGLPIVSSDREFNEDILTKEYAFLVDPNSTDEIEKAINALYADPKLRKEFASKSAEAGKNFSIVNRAKRIIEFIERLL